MKLPVSKSLLLLSVFTATALQQSAAAQGTTNQVAATVIYVDNANGNDVTGNGTINNPFRTLTATMQISSIGTVDVVILLPGVYDESNGETFPIDIPNGLSLQGTNQLKTQIRGTPGAIPPTPLGLRFTAPQAGINNIDFALDVDGAFNDFAILNSLFTANGMNANPLNTGNLMQDIAGSAYVDNNEFGVSPAVALQQIPGFIQANSTDFRLDISNPISRTLIDQGLTIAQSGAW